MCGGVNQGEHNPVSVLLLRNPKGEEPPTFLLGPKSADSGEEARAPGRRARKLWELKRSLHCPVIGT
jgi:hypothetical protein